MEFQDKGLLEVLPFRAFLASSHISLRARYLLFRLVLAYSLAQPGQVVSVGVQRLARDTGFSKDGAASCLSILVSKRNPGTLIVSPTSYSEFLSRIIILSVIYPYRSEHYWLFFGA